MLYFSPQSLLLAVVTIATLIGCLDEFPEYVEVVSPALDMAVLDAEPSPDQGLLCGESPEIVIGMSCTMAGGQMCGVYACVNEIPVCVEAPTDERTIEIPMEACNGRDDDCDGRTDEDFDRLSQTCMMEALVEGEPALGEWICNPNNTDAPNAEPYVCDCCLESEPNCDRPCRSTCRPVGNEVCNDVDDDCDGMVDEDLDAPCDHQLDRCSVMGKTSCVSGVMTACAPPAELPLNCRCIDAAFGGGTHYIHCPGLVSSTRGESICGQVRSSTNLGGVNLPRGRILEIESKAEHLFLSNELYAASAGVKTWLNHVYDPNSDPEEFDEWLAQYFPLGTYHAVTEDDFEDDERRCLSMENTPPYQWGFDPCASVTSGLTCEFCADEMRDNDGDRHMACAADCDDSNPNVYWGAQELCHNGIDENCDGQIDEYCPCEALVHDGHQYLFCHELNGGSLLTWDDAQTQCRDWNMNLLVLDTQSEFLQLAGMAVQLRSNIQWWIGVRQPNRGNDDESDEMDQAKMWRWVETGVLDDAESLWWQDADRNRHDRADRDCGRLHAQDRNRRHIRPDDCELEKAYICESRTPP
jgi:hypothetical protein